MLFRSIALFLCLYLSCVALAAPKEANDAPPPAEVDLFPPFDDGLPKEDLDLELLVGWAREQNPDLKTLRHSWRAAQAIVPQARAVPDPRFTVQYAQIPGFANPKFVHRGYAQVGIAQVLPGRGKIPARTRVAELEAEVRRHLLRERCNEIETEIRRLAVDLYLVETKIQLNRKHQQLLGHFARIAAIQYSVGKGAQPDIVRAQAEKTRIENELSKLWGRRARILTRLAYLCGVKEFPAGRAPTPPDPASFPLEIADLATLSREYRPRLKALETQVSKAEARRWQAESEDNPDVTLALMNRWFQFRPDGVMLTVSVPLPFFNRERYEGAVTQRTQEVDRSKALLEQTLARLDYDIEDRLLAIETAEDQRGIVEKTLLLQARQVLKGSLKNYETGKLEFLNLLDAQRRLLDIELAIYNYRVQAARALAELEGLVGLNLTDEAPLPGRVETNEVPEDE